MLGNQSIIQTRITPPRRRKDLVERIRLIQFLEEMIEKRLVLVSAPAGYGKTSLLVDFVSHSRIPVCWYSIDRLDIDPLRFTAYLTASIQQKFPSFGQRTFAALTGDQGKFNGDYIANVLINDIYENISEHFLIILDDYHLVNDSIEIQNFISKLLLDLDDNCHFIFVSRTLLSLPVLPNLAARSEVDGMSYEELEFLSEEIQALFQQNQQLSLSLDQADEIKQNTEGWITGILLTSQVDKKISALQARLGRVSGFSLQDYFSQIINQLPEEINSFLLWSSLLEEFNANRCAEVIGPVISDENAPWQKWMSVIQQYNLFVMPVGEEGDWLRYHPLFLDFLQNTIIAEQPEIAKTILHNLAKMSIRNDQWDQAFSIYRRLGSQKDLIQLIEQVGLEMILNGRLSTLSAWLDSLPADVLNSNPYIVALQGNVAWVLGNTALAMTLYNQAINSMTLPENRKEMIIALSMRSATFRLSGKLEDSITNSSEILSLIGRDESFTKQKGEALRCIGLCDFHKGNLQDALSNLESALRMMRSINDNKNVAIIQIEIGLIYENLGDYSHSKEYYLSALKYWKQVENPLWLSNLLNNLGVLQQLLGDYKNASLSFEQALSYARSCGYARMEAFILTGIGDIFAEIQADEQAMQAYYMAEVIADSTQEHFLQVYIKIQKALLASNRKEFETSENLFQQAFDLVGANGSAMEHHLVNLEYSGVKIKDNKANEIILSLENTCEFFKTGGHKVQYEKAHLYLALAYMNNHRSEKAIEHLLFVFSSLESEYPNVSLISSASRFKKFLVGYSPDLLEKEYSLFIGQINKFLEKLPALRRELREKTIAIPFAPPTIIIRSLGRMQVEVNNHIVTSSKWQTQAARDLLYMLMAHPEGMTREEISLIFWPDATIQEAKFRFKNTIYRLRRALGKETVILDQNVYRFNNKLDYEYDVENFLRENAQGNQVQDPIGKLSHFREAIKHYKGNFLSEIDYNWVLSPREYLRQIFLNILIQVSMIYFDQSNYDLSLEYCQRAINEDILFEDAYRQAMRNYAAMGNRPAMVHQYQQCVEILEREINASPSRQTHELYESLLK